MAVPDLAGLLNVQDERRVSLAKLLRSQTGLRQRKRIYCPVSPRLKIKGLTRRPAEAESTMIVLISWGN